MKVLHNNFSRLQIGQNFDNMGIEPVLQDCGRHSDNSPGSGSQQCRPTAAVVHPKSAPHGAG